MRQYLGTISREDFKRGKSWIVIPHECNCSHCGIGKRGETIALPIGDIQKQDIGKQVFRVDGIIQVENNEQRDKRLSLRKFAMHI